ncbi:YhcN/YlaJ family sporulation lipoprotein [Alkalihalobacillus trypoxylicola]|uniref:Uncharacterized protein n=1 Tax=Alkalihalobacillus trypoxylicola TaxID=519424 RepID=A0A162E6B8_9BACI|nr:YhcN/YlaJ family sporulation lipoprotein [Alkalihalobacillus trypoxylicola]KYG31860.1 hypothetical protein AZF04_03525 [Alkalihalobacillus trypoxylicola]
MKKFALSFASTLMIVSSLAACGGTDNNQAQDYNRGYAPSGMHSEDMRSSNHRNMRGQGPVTDMFTDDDRYGNTQQRQTRANGYNHYGAKQFGRTNQSGQHGYGSSNGYRAAGQYGGQTGFWSRGYTGGDRPGMVDTDGVIKERAYGNRVGHVGIQSNRNQHGMMNMEKGHRGQNQHGRANHSARSNQSGSQQGYNESAKIAKHVNSIEGVEKARVIVHNNDIIVGIQADENNQDLHNKVKNTVEQLASDSEVHVVTDRNMYNRIQNVDDRIRNGEAMEEVGSTIEDMVTDIGRAIQRPFEHSR